MKAETANTAARTIRFRGRTDDGTWATGSLVVNSAGALIVSPAAPVRRVDLMTVGQYTGVFDRMGREICEGDLLQLHTREGRTFRNRVIYRDGCFRLLEKGGKAQPLTPARVRDMAARIVPDGTEEGGGA